jgi:hypothetical protein
VARPQDASGQVAEAHEVQAHEAPAAQNTLRRKTMTRKKYLYADEPCDRTEGHEDVYAAWQRLFGEPFDRAKAVRVDDDGDSFTYYMPNGHALIIACDGHYID